MRCAYDNTTVILRFAAITFLRSLSLLPLNTIIVPLLLGQKCIFIFVQVEEAAVSLILVFQEIFGNIKNFLQFSLLDLENGINGCRDY